MTLPPHIENKPWISHKNDKAVIIMITTQLSLLKIIEGNRRLRVKVRVRFILFYLKLAPTDPWCNMLQTLLGRKKYEEAMSGKHHHRVDALKNFTKFTWKHLPVDAFFNKFGGLRNSFFRSLLVNLLVSLLPGDWLNTNTGDMIKVKH